VAQERFPADRSRLRLIGHHGELILRRGRAKGRYVTMIASPALSRGPSMHPLRLMSISCIAAVVGLILVPAARGNIGPRWWGDVASEPWGLKEVAITHERLTIDLRPLAAVEPVQVEVVDDLSNAGACKKLELLFVSGQEGVSAAHLRSK
jgi:hypothetical protein